MTQFFRRGQWFLVPWLMLLSLPGESRCDEMDRQPAPVAADPAQFCQDLPKCCRDHVHVFLVNGLDPANIGNLAGLRDHVRHLGFHQAYYGQVFHVPYFKKEMRRIHREDPEARFILVGFSVGVNLVHSMAEAVEGEGIKIDCLMYLSGNNYVTTLPSNRPANVERVINILASGPLKYIGERDYAENVRLPDSWHFGSPGSNQTKELLARELAASGAAVPVMDPPTESMSTISGEPTPRPVKTLKSSKRDDWDFLKPVSRLGEPPTSPKEALQVQSVDAHVAKQGR